MDKKEFLEKIYEKSREIFSQRLGNGTEISFRHGPRTGIFVLQTFADGGITVYKEIESRSFQESFRELFGENSVDFIKE